MKKKFFIVILIILVLVGSKAYGLWVDHGDTRGSINEPTPVPDNSTGFIPAPTPPLTNPEPPAPEWGKDPEKPIKKSACE